MKKYLDAHRKVDATFAISGFALAEDGVHPGETGHWLMAKSILLGLGEKAVARAADVKSAMAGVPNPDPILKLVAERQNLLKDAWLTATGHKRPGMKAGLPLDEAQTKAREIDAKIKKVLGNYLW